MPKISVIVPVYNTEQYLPRCIDSILAQTFTDFELLLIDDGSKDNSGKICDEYAAKDSRIQVFHKENGGVSSTRNLGLDNAQGEWIVFVDSDDWIEPHCIDSCIIGIEENPYIDIIRYGYYKETPTNKVNLSPLKNAIISSPIKMLEFSNKYCYWGFIWNTVFRKSVLGKLRFKESLCWCEDHVFTYAYIGKCKDMLSIAKPLYHYRITNNGLSTIKDAYTIKNAAEEEFITISYIVGYEKAADSYYNKLSEAISILYKYEKSFDERFRFHKEFTILPQAIPYKTFIISLYKSKHIAFWIKDSILKIRFSQSLVTP